MTSLTERDPSSWLPLPPWQGPPVPRWMVEESEEEPRSPRRVTPTHPQPKPTSPGPMYPGGPGCRAADSCLLVHGYLVNLAEGKSGFGVLRVAKERLEEGAAGAARMGQAQLAAEMREVAQALPKVHTAEEAAALAPRMKQLTDETWELGRRCGGHNLSPQQMVKARELARQVKEGTLTMDQAVKQVHQPEGESNDVPNTI